jgi:hypothetical protein
MFTHAMNFLKECENLKWEFKEVDSKTFFTSLLNDLSTKDLITLGHLLSTKILKSRKQLYATPSKQS